MMTNFLAKLFGTANARAVKRLKPIVQYINALEPLMEKLSDEQLGAKTNEFRKQLAEGKTLDDILPEAFAVVRETAKRKIGQRHYDVQLMGGIVLHQGKISEMKTGEGKTLTATLPLYLNALSGKGAHLVTVNDYLAQRDSSWMTPLFEHLGLTVGVLTNSMPDADRKKAYECDIMYATNNELGFDYLRDNMKFRLSDYVQRELNYAIVDEVDSILIDEARTPLIISGSSSKESELYVVADSIVKRLTKETDYVVDEKARSVQLTEEGNDKVESALRVDNLYAMENLSLLHHITQALKAHAIFKLDVDYVVHDGEVLIVDEFTGRILAGRRYSDGLHQALEAKEGVTIERETQTLASITLQNFFRLYKKLGGMTGTAVTEAEEFHKIYKLDVVALPTNLPMIRADKTDLIYLTKMAKYKSIVKDVLERHKKGQPVLVGTVAVETSELLSSIFKSYGVPHEVLNAKQHAREAEIVAHAGEPGRITIATNMAGRGTDIKLTKASKDAGGLYILGTERHESRRIDNQLRGRSGRQGDPGESRFYISLEDDLIRIFAGDSLKNTMQRWGMKEDEPPIESKFVSRTIEQSQEKVEKRNFETRKHLIEYDDVLNQHRTVVYRYRREVLESEQAIYDLVRDFINGVIEDVLAKYCPKGKLTHDARKQVISTLSHVTGLHENEFENAGLSSLNYEQFTSDVINFILSRYDLLRNQQNQDRIHEAEKWIMLEIIDTAWKQHMLNIDHLKEGINYRSWANKNPLIEYKREAFVMFQDMMEQVRQEVVGNIFRFNAHNFNEHDIEHRRQHELEQLKLESGEIGEMAIGDKAPVRGQKSAQPLRRDEDKRGRNDLCTCGSGKKYKKCCGAE
jgi:preprotein translocase subunit SecA